MGRIGSDTLYGTLGLVVLKAVEAGPLHGLAISRFVRETTDDELVVEEGALYPALHRLEREGFLKSGWGRSNNNRRARFYSLTARGRKQLEREARDWMRHARALSRILGADLAEP